MRGIVPGLQSPHPLIELMPAAFAEDDLMVRLTEAFDDVLSASLASLDCITAYFDPRLAPADFLELLACWLGVALDDNTWPTHWRRDAVLHAVELHRGRGTAAGLQWHLDLMTDRRARVVDDGGVSWSTTPQADSPVPSPALVVLVSRELSDAEVAAVSDVVAMAKPAHLPHVVQVVDEL